MLNSPTLAALRAPSAATMPAPSAPGFSAAYREPERRCAGAFSAGALAQVLDEIDYGLLLLAPGRQVLHANYSARAAMIAGHPLQLLCGELHARLPRDAAPLNAALQAAFARGLRRLVTLGEGGQRAAVSVVPLAGPAESGAVQATLLMLAKPHLGGTLAVQAFARAHALSPGEEQVLVALSQGDSPQAIARRHGVKIATVRTQLSSIRAKTGSDSLRHLLRQVAVLPPFIGALRLAGAAAPMPADRAGALQAA